VNGTKSSPIVLNYRHVHYGRLRTWLATCFVTWLYDVPRDLPRPYVTDERLNAACSIKPMSSFMGAPMNRHSDQVVNDIPARYFLVLGAAAADLWSELPQELQHQLFEHAVVLGHQGEQDESLREQLAKFLHDHHERTLAR
jgi:hypothetical protein